MPASKPPSESVLSRAVEARAEGNCWRVVGAMVQRSEHTVRKWPQMYPDRWGAAIRAATRRVIDDAATESVFVLRELIRALDTKTRLKAAWYLVQQRLEVSKLEVQAAALAAPPPPSDAQLIAAFVEAQPREQLIKLAANLLNVRVPERVTVSRAEATGAG